MACRFRCCGSRRFFWTKEIWQWERTRWLLLLFWLNLLLLVEALLWVNICHNMWHCEEQKFRPNIPIPDPGCSGEFDNQFWKKNDRVGCELQIENCSNVNVVILHDFSDSWDFRRVFNSIDRKQEAGNTAKWGVCVLYDSSVSALLQ